MKNKWLVLGICLLSMVILIFPMTPMTQAESDTKSGLAEVQESNNLTRLAQDGEPGDPVVIGEPGLIPAVEVFPYDVDIFGIYLIQGDEVSIVTSVPVEHINIDRVTAKLSPDGYKVAYLVEYGSTGASRLMIVGIDGLSSNPLWESHDPGRYISSFSWSHDSNQVAYALSRDNFAAGPDIAGTFENPDLEVDPLAENALPDAEMFLTGEVWITDLYGESQQQIVDHGAMDVLGWAFDDTGIMFTRYMTATYETEITGGENITPSRLITPTLTLAQGVSVVDITEPSTVVDVLVNDLADPDNPIYTHFYLLEDEAGEQKLAVVSAEEMYLTLPSGDTQLWLMDLSPGRSFASLSLTPVLTNTGSMHNVTLSPDGTKLAFMTYADNDLWLSDLSGNSTQIVAEGLSNRTLIWSVAGDAVGAYTQENTIQVTGFSGELGSLSVIPSDALIAEPLNSHVVKDHNVPFVHQLWDTKDSFGGNCACGAASATMALAFYQKITANPMNVSYPSPRTTPYGWYMTEQFSTFNTQSTQGCWQANKPVRGSGFGVYGVAVRQHPGGIWGGREYIEAALNKVNLPHSRPGFPPTLDAVKSHLDQGQLVILSTQLTDAGHIILVKGYTNDGKVIVHDPYGNRFGNTYGAIALDGANLQYSWNQIQPKWSIAVHGTPPPGGGGCGGGAPTITHWRGEYFNNRDLSGQPSLVRNDTGINFDWGGGSPSSGCINADNFSVRWARTMHFDRGTYRFRTTTDDGVRLYVNNQLVINKWYDQGATTHESGDVFLPGGNATIRMEYYERGGAAVAKLNWHQVSSSSTWRGEYFNNRTLSGNPTFVRNDDSVFFNWGSGGPGGGIGNDNFSVRWTKTLNIPRSGYYQFYARADDGVRVWVNGQLRINGWRDQAPTTYGSDWLYLSSGNNSIKVEYYERGGGAYIRVWMVPAFYTQFYPNRNLSGSPSHTAHYTNVDFSWGAGGPPNTPSNDFSARFTGHAALSGGRYKFCTRTDDGVRLYINGTLVINKWQDQGATTWCTDRDLSRGFHEIKMEYYERGGAALAQMWWNKYSGSDALAAAMSVFDEPEDFDIWALYGDNGYLGPLIEADITSLTVAPGESLFLPLIVR